ncbi:MAG TPA: DUF882 domain-containing protein [Candidatus Acidoferrum sp.]|nr:DUF882 domain-containing protein [Candidatus Acidoferrum sp.]
MHKPRTICWCLLAAGTMLFLIAATGVRTEARVASRQQSSSADNQEHRLLLYNTHTAERIDIIYRRGDQYLPAALTKLDYFLRDHRTGDVRHFDPRLYDILSDLTTSVGHPGGELDIVCGYRTSSTNESLRAHTTGVAKNSLHIQAEAIDLRMPGIDTLKLRKAALALGRGGVGYYPHSDFIHVDVGRVRQWCFQCSASLVAGD